jgi:hypothetical protein
MAKSEKDLAAEALAAMTGGTAPPESSEIPFQPLDEQDEHDEHLAAPAPDASVFAPKRRTTDLLAQQRLESYRTTIPILLTLGVLFPAIGLLKWLAPEGSPFADWDTWVSIVLFVASPILLTVAIVNMRYVRHQLSQPLSRPRQGV